MAGLVGLAEDSYFCESARMETFQARRKQGRRCPSVLTEGSILLDLEAIQMRRFKLGSAEDCWQCHYKTEGLAQKLARSTYLVCASQLASSTCVIFWGLWCSICRGNAATNVSFSVVESVLVVYFLAEWSIRFLAHAEKRNVLSDFWMVVDGGLALLMLLDTCYTFAFLLVSDQDAGNSHIEPFERLLCFLRLAQMGRLAKLLSAVPDVVLLAKALWNSCRCLFACLGLLATSIYVFAVACVSIMEGTRAGDTYFATLGQAISTILLHAVFMDDVSEIVHELHVTGLVYSVVFVGFILFVHYCLFSTVIGMTCEVCRKFMKSEQRDISFNLVQKQISVAIEDLGFQAERITKNKFKALLENGSFAAMLEELGADVSGLLCCMEAVFADRKELSLSSLVEVILSSRCSASTSSWDFRQRALLTLAVLEGRAQQDDMAEAIDRLERRFLTRLSMQEVQPQNPQSLQVTSLREEAAHFAPPPSDAEAMKSDGSLASWEWADTGDSEKEATSIIEQSMDTLLAELHKTLIQSREKIMRAHLQALSQMTAKTEIEAKAIAVETKADSAEAVSNTEVGDEAKSFKAIANTDAAVEDKGGGALQLELANSQSSTAFVSCSPAFNSSATTPSTLSPPTPVAGSAAQRRSDTRPDENIQAQLASPRKEQGKSSATSTQENSQRFRLHTRSSFAKANGTLDDSALKDRSLSRGRRSTKDLSRSTGRHSSSSKESPPRRSGSPRSVGSHFYRGQKMSGLASEGSQKASDRLTRIKKTEVKDPLKNWILWPRFKNLIVSRMKEESIAMNGSYSDALFRRVDRKNEGKLQYAQIQMLFRGNAFKITEKEMSNAELRLFCQQLDLKRDGHVEIRELMKLAKLSLDGQTMAASGPKVSDAENLHKDLHEATSSEALADKAQDESEELPSGNGGFNEHFKKNTEEDFSNPYTCPECKLKMNWSDFAEGNYRDGWICRYYDDCQSCFKLNGRWRWFCNQCIVDVCADCCEDGVVDPSSSSSQASRRSSRRCSEDVADSHCAAQDEEVRRTSAAITLQSVQRGRATRRELIQKQARSEEPSSGKPRSRSQSLDSTASSIRSTPTLEPNMEMNAHAPNKKEKRDSFEVAEPSEGAVLKFGDVVHIVGLKQNPQLNGDRASILEWKEAKSRYRVRLSNGEVKLFKSMNLKLA